MWVPLNEKTGNILPNDPVSVQPFPLTITDGYPQTPQWVHYRVDTLQPCYLPNRDVNCYVPTKPMLSYKYTKFNGKERDDEVYGQGNLNTAEFW
ncbi:MAG: hypothetical protein SGJ04_05945 [Bacteroidota bacterium]|nr:hypothetical protein [Bacteroidota bacterium]